MVIRPIPGQRPAIVIRAKSGPTRVLKPSAYRVRIGVMSPWLERQPLGFSVSFAPRRSGTGHARHGGDRPSTNQ